MPLPPSVPSSIPTAPSLAPVRRTAVVGTSGAHLMAVLALAGACVVAVPAPPLRPATALGALAGATLAVGLLLTRRHQPHIDDREVDLILATTAGAAALWTVLEWDTQVHPAAATAARLLTLAASVLVVSGTRAAGWLWPTAFPPLLSLAPQTGVPILPGAMVLVAGAVTIVLLSRARAPRDQLAGVRVQRLAAAGAGVVLVGLVARVGAGA